MLRHADGREAIDAHAEAHFYIRTRGPADGIHQFVLMRGLAGLIGEHEQTILVPGDLVRLHPERIHMHFVLRLLVRFSRRSHRKSPAATGTMS